jgi:16S rRNA (cytidine1402-2'-O)-methyltransferase
MSEGTLYLIAGPIGNLEDFTFRAKRILEEVDFVLAEHPRHLQRLLSFYQLKTPLLSYHQHTSASQKEKIADLLKEGKNLALMTDAGTPGLADPGNELISELKEKIPSLKIIPLPGASALTTAISCCGFKMGKFLFLGFLPKKKRKVFLEKIAFFSWPVVFYESPYRLLKTLEEIFQLKPNLEIFIGRELTKKFETLYRGKIEAVVSSLKKGKIKGELVVIVNHDGKK